jgi:hypothetical protein
LKQADFYKKPAYFFVNQLTSSYCYAIPGPCRGPHQRGQDRAALLEHEGKRCMVYFTVGRFAQGVAYKT